MRDYNFRIKIYIRPIQKTASLLTLAILMFCASAVPVFASSSMCADFFRGVSPESPSVHDVIRSLKGKYTHSTLDTNIRPEGINLHEDRPGYSFKRGFKGGLFFYRPIGLIKASFQLRGRNSGQRSSILRGGEIFKDGMKLATSDPQTWSPRYFAANWNGPGNARKTPVSDNFFAFKKLIEGPNAISPIEAAWNTWSGQQAKKYGFTEIEYIFLRYTQGKLNNVEIFFKNPKTRSPFEKQNDPETKEISLELNRSEDAIMNEELQKIGEAVQSGKSVRDAFHSTVTGHNLLALAYECLTGNITTDPSGNVTSFVGHFRYLKRNFIVNVLEDGQLNKSLSRAFSEGP